MSFNKTSSFILSEMPRLESWKALACGSVLGLLALTETVQPQQLTQIKFHYMPKGIQLIYENWDQIYEPIVKKLAQRTCIFLKSSNASG